MKALAPQHPEWKDKEPFASLLKGDLKAALAGGEPAIFQIRHNSIKLYASTGVSTRTGSDFDAIGIAWQYRWGSGL